MSEITRHAASPCRDDEPSLSLQTIPSHRVLGKTLWYIPRSPRSLSYLVSRSSRPRPHLLSKGDGILDKTHSKRKGNDGPGSRLLPGSEFGAFAHGFGLPLCAFHGLLALGTGDRGIEMTPLAPPVPGAVRFARPRGRQDVPCDCGRLRRFRFRFRWVEGERSDFSSLLGRGRAGRVCLLFPQ